MKIDFNHSAIKIPNGYNEEDLKFFYKKMDEIKKRCEKIENKNLKKINEKEIYNLLSRR